MPELNEAVAKFKGKDIAFVGLTFDKTAETQAFLKQKQFDYQVIAEAKNIFDQYKIQPCPVSIVIDKSGKIVFANLGYEPYQQQSFKTLVAAIESALS